MTIPNLDSSRCTYSRIGTYLNTHSSREIFRMRPDVAYRPTKRQKYISYICVCTCMNYHRIINIAQSQQQSLFRLISSPAYFSSEAVYQVRTAPITIDGKS